MDKLKVGIVLDEKIAPSEGGAYSYYERIINAIDKFSFNNQLEIVFLDFNNSEELNFSKIIYKIKKLGANKKTVIDNIPFVRSIYNCIASSNTSEKTVEKQLIELGVDLLYYVKPTYHQHNFPFIMTHWDLGHKSMFAFPEVSMNKTYNQRLKYQSEMLGKAFAIFTESEQSKSELCNYEQINPNRIFTAPLFPGKVIELDVSDRVQLEILTKWNLNKKEFYFYPAQFWSHKNHYGLLIAFKKLLLHHADLKLVFSGSDKGNLEYIKQVISDYNLNQNVIITGFVSDEEVFTFYKNTISLVMPTYLGPTNMPLIEAFVMGTQIICSNFAGHREEVGDNAHYINPENSESIYEKLLLTLENKNIKVNPNSKINSIGDTIKFIERNLIDLIPYRKTFGNNFNQF